MDNLIRIIDNNVYLVWKPKSVTPNEQLDKLKIDLKYEGKACFAGRLDPMASGEMLYFIDTATKLAPSYMKIDKTYEFYIVCGISTDSMDCMGNITTIDFEYDISNFESIFYNIYNGKYDNYTQIMPSCSAYIAKHKITGEKRPLWHWKKLNQLENIDYPKPSNIELIEFDVLEHNVIPLTTYVDTIVSDMNNVKQFDLKEIQNIIEQWNLLKLSNPSQNICMIKCVATVQSGTYIRYLANMIGKDVNVPTHCFDIKRTKLFLN